MWSMWFNIYNRKDLQHTCTCLPWDSIHCTKCCTTFSLTSLHNTALSYDKYRNLHSCVLHANCKFQITWKMAHIDFASNWPWFMNSSKCLWSRTLNEDFPSFFCHFSDRYAPDYFGCRGRNFAEIDELISLTHSCGHLPWHQMGSAAGPKQPGAQVCTHILIIQPANKSPTGQALNCSNHYLEISVLREWLAFKSLSV